MQIRVAKCIAKVAPHAGVSGIDPQVLTRDTEELAAHARDPFVYHGKISAKIGVELLHAMQGLAPRLADVNWPCLVVQGMADTLTTGVDQLQAKAPPANLTVKVIPFFLRPTVRILN